MIDEYDKKDMKKSPQEKKVKKEKKEFTLPKGWELYLKRGTWGVRSPEGTLTKFALEKDAKKYIEEMS
jgi:hypothetical protein